MIFPKDRNIHRPFRLYLPDFHYYFITGKTYKGLLYFRDNSRKRILLDVILGGNKRFKTKLFAWVVVSNHYHFLIRAENPKTIGDLTRFINGKSSYLLNKLDNQPSRKIWYQYRDKIVEDQEDFYTHLNYIHQNPIKHRLVKNFEEMALYQFYSYKDYLRRFGRDWLDDCFLYYPVINYIKE